MKKLFSLLLVLLSHQLFAQSVSVEKNGLVEVDGKPAFYLVEKNKKILGEKDFSLQNLSHEELAYLALNRETYWDGNMEATKYYFRMVFTKTGSTCDIININLLNVKKQLAKTIAGANLVQNGAVNIDEERKFVKLHYGQFRPDEAAAPAQVVINNQAPAPAVSRQADVVLKENKIYNNGELIGQFKLSKKDFFDVVSIYNNSGVMICDGMRDNREKDADWNLQLSGNKMAFLYDPAKPVENIVKLLVERGYFN